MSIQVTRLLTAGKSRTNGEEVHVQGSGFMLLPSSYAPANLRIAVDSHEGNQMPALPGVFVRQDFHHLWVFHDLAGGSYPEPLTIITLDDPHAYMLPGDAAFSGLTRTASVDFATGVNTTLVAPGAGQLVRALRYRYQLSADATLAAAGAYTLSLQDTSTIAPFTILSFPESTALYYLPAASPAGAFGSLDTGWIALGGGAGVLVPGPNHLLTVQGSDALATGSVRVSVEYRLESR